jgi:predicted 2-oxoglutarate/Fe(II)-dependent dioxygenase YbiX
LLRFPEFGSRLYAAPRGGAVVFSCSLLHEATPVTKGRRYMFLPFLYDEAARAVRDRNLNYVAALAGETADQDPTPDRGVRVDSVTGP